MKKQTKANSIKNAVQIVITQYFILVNSKCDFFFLSVFNPTLIQVLSWFPRQCCGNA